MKTVSEQLEDMIRAEGRIISDADEEKAAGDMDKLFCEYRKNTPCYSEDEVRPPVSYLWNQLSPTDLEDAESVAEMAAISAQLTAKRAFTTAARATALLRLIRIRRSLDAKDPGNA